MKIAYLDFNENDFYEDYSINPKSYGGGRVFASIAKEIVPDFHLFSNHDSFKNLLDKENKQSCHSLSSEQRDKIRSGLPIKDIIKNAEFFDLFVHHQTQYSLNLNGLNAKSCCWAVGYNDIVHPNNKNLLLYNNFQNPKLFNETKIQKIIIGKPIPTFEEYCKENFIFQCSRHTKTFGSIEVAQICLANNIKVYFAGPIESGYPLLDYVDNKTVHYLGSISENDKIEYLKKARLTTYLHSWNTSFNLSAIESLSYGTPIISTNVGFWGSLINDKNGAIIYNSEDFLNAYYNNFSQKQCYNSAIPYSQDKMIESFSQAFKNIYEKN